MGNLAMLHGHDTCIGAFVLCMHTEFLLIKNNLDNALGSYFMVKALMCMTHVHGHYPTLFLP